MSVILCTILIHSQIIILLFGFNSLYQNNSFYTSQIHFADLLQSVSCNSLNHNNSFITQKSLSTCNSISPALIHYGYIIIFLSYNSIRYLIFIRMDFQIHPYKYFDINYSLGNFLCSPFLLYASLIC